MPEYKLSVVVFPERTSESDLWWVAQCLEYDIAVQAKTFPELQYEFQRAVVAHLGVTQKEGLKGLEDLSPAPQAYWEAFHLSQGTDLIIKRAPFRLPAEIGVPFSLTEPIEARIADQIYA